MTDDWDEEGIHHNSDSLIDEISSSAPTSIELGGSATDDKPTTSGVYVMPL